jgi:hypothetical protein
MNIELAAGSELRLSLKADHELATPARGIASGRLMAEGKRIQRFLTKSEMRNRLASRR